MPRVDPLADSVSPRSSGCRASGRRAPSAWPITCSRPRATSVNVLCDAIAPASRTASPIAASAATITDVDPCSYCTASDRDPHQIASSSSRKTSPSIEKTRGFRGRDHVLMGAIAPLHGIGPDGHQIKGLLARVAGGEVAEVILATNPTVEGEATALYLATLLSLGPPADPHCHGCPGRQRPGLRRRVHHVEGDGRTTRDLRARSVHCEIVRL